jgi:PPOX class probable F420-dependent enzyme
MEKVPEEYKDLLEDETKAFAFLATIMMDGSPQVTPVWFDVEGDLLRFNTARGRVKDRNLTERPWAAIAIPDPDDPYRYIQLRGRVEKAVEEGGRAHIDRLAKKYQGLEAFPGPKDQVRVMYYFRPKSVTTKG